MISYWTLDDLDVSQTSEFSELPELVVTAAVQHALQVLPEEAGDEAPTPTDSANDQVPAASVADAATTSQVDMIAPMEAAEPPPVASPTNIRAVHFPTIIVQPIPDLVVGSGGSITCCPPEQSTDDDESHDDFQLKPLRNHRRTLRAARHNEDQVLLSAL